MRQAIGEARGRASGARARAPWADPVLGGLAGLAVALIAFFLLAGGRPIVLWTVQTGLDVTMLVFVVRLAGVAADRHARRFWRLVALACVSSAVGDSYQTVQVVRHPGDPRISVVQTGFVVIGMVVVVVGMLLHPLGGTGRQRLRLWLDSGIVLAAVMVFLWDISLASAFSSGGTAERWAAAATSIVMLLIAFALLKLLLSGTAPFTVAAGVTGSVGVAGTAVGTSVTTVLTGSTDPRVMTLVAVLPCVLTAAALRLQEVQVRRGSAARTTERRKASRLPYLAVIAVQGLLVVALAAHHTAMRIAGVTAGTLLVTGLVLIRQSAAFRDNERLLTELEALHEEVRHQATHDGLTGLANRALLNDRLRSMPAGDQVTILLVDLDGFKPVNDRHGHATGDQVLVTVARRMARLVGEAGLTARLGGDEFAVLLPGTPPGVRELAAGIAAVVGEPILLDGKLIVVGASVGSASGDVRDADRLLHHADVDMYSVKAARRKPENDFAEQSVNYQRSPNS